MLPTIYATPEEAVADVRDGTTVLIGGFNPGSMAWSLWRALWYQGAKDLTLVANGAGFGRLAKDFAEVKDPGLFISAGRVKKVIVSFSASPHPSQPSPMEALIRSGELEAEVVPQGTLAERLRAGGAGIPAFFTPTGVGTLIAEGKEIRTFGGREYVMEKAIAAEYAFVHAAKADTAGNCIFRRASRNFNPVMATAADCTIVEADEIVAAGELDPDFIHLPGVYVNRLVKTPTDGVIPSQWWALAIDKLEQAATARYLARKAAAESEEQA